MLTHAILVGCAVLSTGAADVAKRVIHTSWWPPGSEKTAESVGIVSYDFVYMTAMMEFNSTLGAEAQAEISDVSDIAHAGGVDVEMIVDCLINAPLGKAKAARRAFIRALSKQVNSSSWKPAMTVVEMPGEYPGGWFKASATCIAALPPAKDIYPRQQWSLDHAFGVSAQGLLHIEATGASRGTTKNQTAEALRSIDKLVRAAGGRGAQDAVDCLAFIQDIKDARSVRAAMGVLKQAPALTIVQAGLENPRQKVALRCVATVPKGPKATPVITEGPGGAKLANNQFVYVEGQFGTLASNGTDALKGLDVVLRSTGTDLSKVVNCLFFLTDNNLVYNLFNGFQRVFNQDNPPPPTRGEFQGLSECSKCFVVAKCIAALPVQAAPLQSIMV